MSRIVIPTRIILTVLILLLPLCKLQEGTQSREDCRDIQKPNSLADCNVNPPSTSCCFFMMESPQKGNTCVPIDVKFLPFNYNSTQFILPGEINITGIITCGSVSNLVSVFIVLFILI